MEFGEVREQTIGNTRLLVLAGRWSDRTLKEVFRMPADPGASLPDYVPDFVRIYVDADAHLPRRIQYLKKHPDPTQKQVRPVVTLDFRHIKLNEEVDDDIFKFERAADDEIKEVDLTAAVIDGIRKIAAGPEANSVPEEPAEEGAPG